MRAVLVMLMALALCAPIAAPVWAAGDGAALVASGQQPEGRVDVNVDLDRGGAWYTNPVWIAIGVIALVVLVLLIVMATRGGGTTVVKE
jgi:hypothetical protein